MNQSAMSHGARRWWSNASPARTLSRVAGRSWRSGNQHSPAPEGVPSAIFAIPHPAEEESRSKRKRQAVTAPTAGFGASMIKRAQAARQALGVREERRGVG